MKITVQQNYFPCNCRVIYLLESRLGNSTDFLRSNKCISPFDLNGRPMVDMKQVVNLQQCNREDLDKTEAERERRRKEKEERRKRRRRKEKDEEEKRKRKQKEDERYS